MRDLIVELDSRNRVSLTRVANRHDRYLVREEPDGTLILEPSEVLTKAEKAYLADPELQAIVEHGRSHPEKSRPRPTRT